MWGHARQTAALLTLTQCDAAHPSPCRPSPHPLIPPPPAAVPPQIILKHLKIRVAEGSVFKNWHKDAESYYNNSGARLLGAAWALRACWSAAPDPAHCILPPRYPPIPTQAWTCASSSTR